MREQVKFGLISKIIGVGSQISSQNKGLAGIPLLNPVSFHHTGINEQGSSRQIEYILLGWTRRKSYGKLGFVTI